ncbi:MAG: tagatose 1,6-diphosphate aldolase [Sedimentisphaerales bacterium]|nr:tagatose 1,6-diphosphate aldolase [Sedimentisphaerales bacterium]
MPMTIGKWRRLQQTAGPNGTFYIAAVDHRGPLRRALETESPEGKTDEALTSLKRDIVRHLAPATSAVLLDPETAAGQCVTDGSLPGGTGLIVALDSGSTGDPLNRTTGLIENWSVEKTVRMGASGVKILLYYNPQAPQAEEREGLVRNVARKCIQYDIPFFLEPLSYACDDQNKAVPPEEKRRVVIETARRLVPLGVDILKAEFPVDVSAEPDENIWLEACRDLTDACEVPWVLLSAGVSYETFLKQVRIACQAGASGVMAGRAVWKEAVTLNVSARNQFLKSAGYERMQGLKSLCEQMGRPFTEVYDPPELSYDWYVD